MEMAKQMEASPLDARFPLFLGVLLQAYGDLENAGHAFEKAHELSPAKQTILFEIGSNKFARGDVAGALETYREAHELAPEFLDARLFYAAVAIRAKEDALAEELLAPILESGAAADVRIAAAYVSRGQYNKLIPIWETRVRVAPQDVQAYYTLAAAYYATGQAARAISTLEALSKAVPEAKAQADMFIRQIRDGTLKLTL
jgi:tetratricopeptide (TPR) repeat protein